MVQFKRNNGAKLQKFILKMMAATPEIAYTDIWIQKYEKGAFINPHCDPASHKGMLNYRADSLNPGCVLIAVLGEFEGGELVVEGQYTQARPGITHARLELRIRRSDFAARQYALFAPPEDALARTQAHHVRNTLRDHSQLHLECWEE